MSGSGGRIRIESNWAALMVLLETLTTSVRSEKKKLFFLSGVRRKKGCWCFCYFLSLEAIFLCVHSQSYTHIFRLAKPISFLPASTAVAFTKYSTSQIRSFSVNAGLVGEREGGTGMLYTATWRKAESALVDMMRWIILFSCFSFLSRFTVFIILLPFASAYARVGNVMMFCMLRLGVFSPLPFVVGCINLYSFLLHSGITNVDAGGDFSASSSSFLSGYEFFFFFSIIASSFFLFRRVNYGWGGDWCEKAFTRLIFVGNFSTINVSTKRKKEKRKKRKHTIAPKA